MANTAPTFSVLKSFGIVSGPFHSNFYSSLVLDPTGNLLLAGSSESSPRLEGLTVDGVPNTGMLGGDGYAELPVTPSEDTFLRLDDGRMLVAGYFTVEGAVLRLRVYRLLADGSIDTTFGTGGYAEKVLSGDLGNAVVAMAVQTDGKVVVGTRPGTIFGDSTGNFIAVRFDAAGNLDTTFGPGGVVNQSIGSGLDVVDSIQIQSDGKILIAGSTANGLAQLTDFAVLRLNPDGSLDAGFNGTGKLVVPVSSGDFDNPVRLLLQADGQILLVGYSNLGNRFGPSVIRVNGDGTLDSSFGTAGKVIVDLPGYSNTISSASLQADGKLVLVGASTVTNGDTDCLVVRLNVDGSLDTSFGGGDGVVRIPAGYIEYPSGLRMVLPDSAADVAILPDGRILIAGNTPYLIGPGSALLIRLLPDGSLDPTFHPTYQNTLGGSTSYVDGDAPVLLDGSVSVFDAELAALHGGAGDYGGAQLTLSRAGGAQAADQFGVGGTFAQVGSTIQLAGAVVANVTQTPGRWVLTFSANVSQSTVNALLSSITYSNDGTDIGSTFDILWSFNDGNAGVQGAGGSLAATGRTTVTVDGQVMNVITGTDQAETLTGGVAADEISGLGGNDRLIGDGGDDVLDGGAGADTLDGGSGDDVYYVESTGDVVTETLAGVEGGGDIVVSSINYTLGAHLEHLMLVGAATIGTGNELANILFGGDLADTLNGLADTDSLMGGGGNDSLDGGTGADTMAGEAGDDSYRVDNAGDIVVEAAGGGTDQVVTTVNYTLAAGVAVEILTVSGTATALTGNEFDNTLVGGSLADSLSGGSGNDSLNGGVGLDTLLGGAGNDTLNGGGGADSLVGSLGDDLYIVDNTGDILVESAGSGTDRLWASVNYTLAGGVAIETLTLTGSATALTGNEFAQTINGSSLADSLNGAAGNDNLVGNAGADTLVGGADNDTLNGGAGIDSLVGGTGHDLYMIDSAADVIVEVAGEGSDRLWAAVNYTLAAGVSVETLTLTGTATRIGGNEFAQTIYGGSLADSLDGAGAADSLIGGAGNDSLLGGEGSDTLVGGAGVDNMAGGLGDDLYWVDSASDVIVEAAGEGADRIWASVNFTLATGVSVETITAVNGATALTGNELANTLYGGVSGDSLDGAGGADSLMGNAGADTLIGGDGADTLNGGAGVDRLVGGLGDDLYVIDAASDVIVEAAGEGSDRLWASANYTLAAGVSVESMTLLGTATGLTGNEGANNLYGSAQGDTLNGGAGNDTVNGAAGNDTLYGGLGNDTLTGGAGNDRFVFDSAPAAGTNVDTISDFAAGDLIALDNDVFTALGAVGALSPTAWHSGAGVSGASAAGQLAGVYYNSTTGSLYYDADGFGGVAAVQFATLTTKPGLTAASFVVVE